MFKWIIILLALLLAFQTKAQITLRGDSVQQVLAHLATFKNANDLVDYLPETQRWYLTLPHSEVSDHLLTKLQDAFLYDVESYCQYYAWKYSIDWRVLASKAARESFWGTSYLANRSLNFFGIRLANKEWACSIFGFCESIEKDDPMPADFIIFPNFDASLWMFVHTIYSPHYLARLPDKGAAVAAAIEFERQHGVHYWQYSSAGDIFAQQLYNYAYSPKTIINSWSGYEINNLCVDCSRESDLKWLAKIERAIERREVR